MNNVIDAAVAPYNIVSDGTTDQTTALVAMFNELGTSGFRGFVEVSYNTLFDTKVVYAAVPVGVVVLDDSSINWGQPPTYKNKFRIMYSGDTVDDDTQHIIASGHHPAFMLLNLGTAGTTSAQSRFASILWGYGKGDDGNPLLSLIDQVAKNSDDDTWYHTTRLQTPYDAGLGSTGKWAQGVSYKAGQYANSGDCYYVATTSGTSGATPPTHLRGIASDGGVSWKYKGLIAPDTRIRAMDENGRTAINGVPTKASRNYLEINDSALVEDDTETYIHVRNNKNSSRAGVRVESKNSVGTARRCAFKMNESLQAVIYDETADRTLMAFDQVNGVQYGSTLPSYNFQEVSGTSPTLSSDAAYVNNTAATTMTGMQFASGQSRGRVCLFFSNGKTTLSTSGFTLQGGVGVTPPAGAVMHFFKDPALSSNWIEENRRF